MYEWCLICHKVTEFDEVSYPAPDIGPGYSRYVPGLMYCTSCHMVVFVQPSDYPVTVRKEFK